MKFSAGLIVLAVISLNSATALRADTNGALPVLEIKADQTTGTVSPTLYGLMTEEINYSYEGGLYGELIGNRTFKGGDNGPRWWSAAGGATMSVDTNTPLNDALNWSLKLEAGNATESSPDGIVNSG